MVYLCRGSDCRKHKKELRALREALEGHPVQTVRCQKICKGAVVGAEVGGRVEWFAKAEKKDARRALIELCAKGKLGKALERLRIEKRSGRIR